jgi:hypothetical protein
VSRDHNLSEPSRTLICAAAKIFIRRSPTRISVRRTPDPRFASLWDVPLVDFGHRRDSLLLARIVLNTGGELRVFDLEFGVVAVSSGAPHPGGGRLRPDGARAQPQRTAPPLAT